MCVRACRIETERWRYLTTAIELFGLSMFSLSFAICYLLICCAIIIVVKSVRGRPFDILGGGGGGGLCYFPKKFPVSSFERKK